MSLYAEWSRAVKASSCGRINMPVITMIMTTADNPTIHPETEPRHARKASIAITPTTTQKDRMLIKTIISIQDPFDRATNIFHFSNHSNESVNGNFSKERTDKLKRIVPIPF